MRRISGGFKDVAYEEAVELASQLYDFKTCVYPDGSGYGISDAHQCRKGTEGEISDTLNKIYSGKGKKPKAAELKRATAAINAIEEKYGEEGVQQMADIMGSFLLSSKGRTTTTMSVDEVEALQDPKLQKKLNDAFENDPSSLQGGKNSIIPFKQYPKDIVDAAWDATPDYIKSSFNGTGKPAGKAWKGTDENGEPINGGNGNAARGRELFGIWASQGGKCAYTGKPLPFDYADLEHIRPMGQVGVKAENPKNWVWTLRSVNQTKSDYDMDYLFKGSGKKGGYPGTDNIKSKEQKAAWQDKIDKAAAAGGSKGAFRDKAKSEGFIKEFNNNRRQTIEAFGPKNEKYITMALGRVPVKGDGGKTFSQEVTREGERNAVKNLMGGRGVYTTGERASGKSTAANWINWNYPDMTASQQAKVKQLYNQARDEVASNSNPQGNTAAGFGKRFAELINDEFGS